jgi:hypothetical protein
LDLTLGWSDEKLEKVGNSTLTYYDIYDDDLVLYMPFEDAMDTGGTGNISAQFTTEDLSGLGNTGTIYPNGTQGPSVVKGKIGKALQFDGVDDYVLIPKDPSFNFTTESFSLEGWIKINDDNSIQNIIDHGGTSISDAGYLLRAHCEVSSNRAEIKFSNGEGSLDPLSSQTIGGTSNVCDNQWHHVVGVVDRTSSVAYLYVDGVLENSNNILVSGSYGNGKDILIGDYLGQSWEVNGSIDEVKIYRRVLSADEIKAHYEARLKGVAWGKFNPAGENVTQVSNVEFRYGGADRDLVGFWKFDEGSGDVAEDLSGYGNDGNLTANGSSAKPTWTYGCKFGSCLEFDGVDDYVEVPDDASLDTAFGTLVWTKEAWVYPRSWANWAAIVDKMTSGYWSNSLGGIWASDQGGFTAVIGSGEPGNPPGSVVYVHFKPPLNAWYHVVAVADGEKIYLYLNGELKGSAVITDYIKSTLTPNDAPVIIGKRTADIGPSFDGTIDEVRIYNRALSPEEIKAHYQEGFAERGFADDYLVGAYKYVGVENTSTQFEAPVDQSAVLAIKFDADEESSIKDSSLGKNLAKMMARFTGIPSC